MPQKNTKTALRRRQVCYNSSSVAAVRLCWEGITTEKVKAFLKRKDIVISVRRYGIDALGAMAQGLFCSLLIGTIIDTVGAQFGIPFLTMPVANGERRILHSGRPGLRDERAGDGGGDRLCAALPAAACCFR